MEAHRPTEPKKKRRWRWRQYSLSTLLVVVTIVAAILALVVPAERQRRAVAAIREAGGYVWYDFERGRLGGKTPPPGPDWLRRILGVDYFADVVGASAASRMNDATCSHFSALPRLENLRLRTTQVTDAGLAHLAGLTSLKELDLGGTRVTGTGLGHLTGLTRLQTLFLDVRRAPMPALRIWAS